MGTRRHLSILLIATLVLTVVAVGPTSQPAEAQGVGQFATCAELDGVFGFAGNVVVSIKDLRSRTESTNPPEVSEALDTRQRDAETPGSVSLAESINAGDVLIEYFGPGCASIGDLGTALALTCSAYQTAVNTGGETAVLAIKDLRGYSEPGAFSPMNGLDVLQDAESEIPPSGSRPTDDEITAAYGAVNGYFGQRCDGIDICFWVRAATDTGAPSAQRSAGILRGLQTPGPPGIDAALALISGAITESPFHDSVAEARLQVEDYFACPQPGGTPLPVTGPPSARPLAMLGSAMLAAGALAMGAHRRMRDKFLP